jgi:hypothetical protein
VTTAHPIPYLTPSPARKPHARRAVVAFVLAAYAAGAMFLSMLVVAFPLMDARPSWEYVAAVFGISMFVAWVLSILFAVLAHFARGVDRSLAGWALIFDVAAVCFAVLFLAVA